MHIFIDPAPDAAKGYEERKRLFDLPRSTWADYDTSLISEGGGIFERSAKRITLTPQIKEIFDISVNHVTPNELIISILKAKTGPSLVWGIGTYVKASTETNNDAGDRANDAVRINGCDACPRYRRRSQPRCNAILGRIEMARAGVCLNTDAIDNSAGVDCSDHEVNIKILLNRVVADGDMTIKQRNTLLADMTDDVAELVLRDNYLQTQAISLVASKGPSLLDHQARLMRMLEKTGRLDREIEYLPDDLEVAERMADGKALVRPEISVVLAYSKMWLFDEILASDLPDDLVHG